MSTINEGLKKAQKERDARHLKYRGVLSAQGKERRIFGLKAVLGGALLLILISLALIAYSWWNFEEPSPPPKPQPPKRTKTLKEKNILNAKTTYGKARDFHKRGRLEDARRLYQETLRLDPGYGDALNNLGVIYIHEKKYQAAQSSFEKAIRLKPAYVEPYYNLACLHAIRGEVRQSLVYLKKAVSLNPSVRDWAGRDGDLQNLSGMPEFEEILGKK